MAHSNQDRIGSNRLLFRDSPLQENIYRELKLFLECNLYRQEKCFILECPGILPNSPMRHSLYVARRLSGRMTGEVVSMIERCLVLVPDRISLRRWIVAFGDDISSRLAPLGTRPFPLTSEEDNVYQRIQRCSDTGALTIVVAEYGAAGMLRDWAPQMILVPHSHYYTALKGETKKVLEGLVKRSISVFASPRPEGHSSIIYSLRNLIDARWSPEFTIKGLLSERANQVTTHITENLLSHPKIFDPVLFIVLSDREGRVVERYLVEKGFRIGLVTSETSLYDLQQQVDLFKSGERDGLVCGADRALFLNLDVRRVVYLLDESSNLSESDKGILKAQIVDSLSFQSPTTSLTVYIPFNYPLAVSAHPLIIRTLVSSDITLLSDILQKNPMRVSPESAKLSVAGVLSKSGPGLSDSVVPEPTESSPRRNTEIPDVQGSVLCGPISIIMSFAVILLIVCFFWNLLGTLIVFFGIFVFSMAAWGSSPQYQNKRKDKPSIPQKISLQTISEQKEEEVLVIGLITGKVNTGFYSTLIQSLESFYVFNEYIEALEVLIETDLPQIYTYEVADYPHPGTDPLRGRMYLGEWLVKMSASSSPQGNERISNVFNLSYWPPRRKKKSFYERCLQLHKFIEIYGFNPSLSKSSDEKSLAIWLKRNQPRSEKIRECLATIRESS